MMTVPHMYKAWVLYKPKPKWKVHHIEGNAEDPLLLLMFKHVLHCFQFIFKSFGVHKKD